MAGISGLLKISHGQAIDALTLEVDPDHGLEEDLGVGVAEAAAVDLEVSQKVAPDLGLGAKVDPDPAQKAGNPDQRANLSPSLIGVPIHTQEADLRISMGSHEVGHVLGPPKKMEKEI